MSYVQTDNPLISRDTDSRGLVVTDRAALLKARASRGTAKRMAEVTQQREDFEIRFSMMSSRLDRCESLLQELVQHITTLVSRSTPEPTKTQE